MAGTVTATQSGNTAGGMLLQVYVLVNAGSLGPNTLTALNVDNGSITTTVTGSMVIGALCNGNGGGTAFVGEPGCTVANFNDTTNTNEYGAFFTTLTGTPGATTVGSTTAMAGGPGGMAACEVLASGGTLAQSGSPAVVGTPSATTLATASITPPAGSLLVAVVVTNGNATGPPTITMGTTGTIGALTWTPGPNANGLSVGFFQDIGIWTARVPTVATGIGGSTQPALAGPGWLHQFHHRQHVPEIAAPPAVPVYPPQVYAQPGLAWKTRYRLPQRPKPTAPVNPPYIAGLGGSGYNSWFQDQYGQPRLMVSEQAWLLPSNAGRWNSGAWQSDMDAYFAARAAQGYTAWYGIAWNNVHIDTTALSGGRTWDGIYPLNINGTPGAIATGSETITLNDPFWQRIDYLFGAAVKKGISCFLNISQSYDISSAGSVWQHATNTQGTAFGAALAARYPQTSYPHVFWFFGDDDDGPNDSFYQAILTGMQGAGDTRSLISCEAFTNCNCHIEFDNKTAFSGVFGVPNATYNWIYSYDAPYFGCEDSYAEGGTFPHIPAVYGDGVYYGDTGAGTNPDRAIRNFVWWALSSGSRGFPSTSGPSLIGVGPTSLWQWYSGSVAALTTDPNGTFTTSAVGAIAAYFRELPDWHKLIPDTGNVFITAGRGTRGTCDVPGGVFNFRNTNNYVCGSITPTGTLAVIYCKAAMSITIDQTKLGTGYSATWVDPLSLATQSATTGTTYNSTPLGNNSAGDPDWVLVLQGAPAGSTTTIATANLAGAGAVAALVTQDAGTSTTLAGAGSVTAAVAQAAGSTLAGAGSVADVATQAVTAALQGAGQVTAVATEDAGTATSLAGAGAVNASAVVTSPPVPQYAYPGQTWLRLFHHRQATVPPPPPAAQAGTATLAGAATVTSVVTQDAGTSTTLAGAATVTGVVTEAVTATPAGAGAVNGLVTQPGGGTITGSGAVGTAVTQGVIATLAGAGQVTDVVTLICIAAIAGAGSVNASVAGGGSTANLAGAGAVSAVATQAVTAAAPGAGQVTSLVTQIAPAALAGAGSVNASGAITGTASLTGAGHVTAAAAQAATGTAAAAGTLSALATQTATAALAGAGAISAAAAARQAVTPAQGTPTVTQAVTGTAAVTDPRDGTDTVAARATSTATVS